MKEFTHCSPNTLVKAEIAPIPAFLTPEALSPKNVRYNGSKCLI